MAEVKWIKLVTEFFDDEKIKLIEAMPEADMVLVIWIKLLTLAGKKNMNGYIFLTKNIPYTDEMFSTLFNRPLNTVRLALTTFKNFGMIDYEDDNVIKITNWEKHQNIEGLEKIREQGRKRVAKFREKHKKELEVKKLPLQSPLKEEVDKKRIDKIRLEGNVTSNVTEKGIIFQKTLQEFKKMRNKKKKPMTDLAVTMLLNKLDGLTDNTNEQIEMMKQSIFHTWDSVYPKKNKEPNLPPLLK